MEDITTSETEAKLDWDNGIRISDRSSKKKTTFSMIILVKNKKYQRGWQQNLKIYITVYGGNS